LRENVVSNSTNDVLKLLTGGIRDDTLATVSVNETRFQFREDDRATRESVGDAIQRFRQAISQRVVVGTFSKSSGPAFTEVMSHTDFDFMVLDPEHGPNTVRTHQDLIHHVVAGSFLDTIEGTRKRRA
jgi:hypothetical protein